MEVILAFPPPTHTHYMHSATGRPQLDQHSYVIRVLKRQAPTKRINDTEAGSLRVCFSIAAIATFDVAL